MGGAHRTCSGMLASELHLLLGGKQSPKARTRGLAVDRQVVFVVIPITVAVDGIE